MKEDVRTQIIRVLDDIDGLCQLQQFQERHFRLSPLRYWKLVCDTCKEKTAELKTVADKYVSDDDLLPPTTVKLLNQYREAFDFAEKRFIVHSNNSATN